jgi:large subunit ribosomal protein L2
LKKGDEIISGVNVAPKVGNALPLEKIPLGMAIHNIELTLGKGGQLVRGAGLGAILVARENDYATVKLPSGEMRLIFCKCYATIGVIGNEDHMNVKLGKAGAARWLGRRPKVRGVAMNPVDHPLGGGEGKSSGGRHPVSPWGQPSKGLKTRSVRKISSKFIVKKRK